FDFCETRNKESPVENLGQVVFGERLLPSDYKLYPMRAMTCEKLCTRQYKASTEPAYDFLRNAIILQYSHH
ncbi:hypothetical protein X801_10278, partial [Opisthorchis viverrini]